MKKKFDTQNLTQAQFEAVMNALILLKQNQPNLEVWFNERFIKLIIQKLK